MKPITQEIADKNVDYIVDGITEVIKTFGPRDPGSEGETKANEHFAKVLTQYADDVKTEKFTLHTDAFMGWIYFDIFFMYIGIISIWLNLNILSIALVVACIVLLVLQLIFYKHVTAPFFAKKTSTNVYAAKKPTGTVKRRIIFCGHTDAAYEWGWLYKGGFGLFFATFIGAFIAMILVVVMAIIGIAKHGWAVQLLTPELLGNTYFYVQLCLSIVSVILISLMFNFSNKSTIVDGANDNLTACLTSISVLKTMQDENIVFENTEVCALMAGSEEAGLRGAMAFSKAHKAELDKDAANGIETIFIVLETLREKDCLSIYNKDMNGVVPADPQVCKLLKIAAKEAINKDLHYSTVSLGSTDAAAFSNAGLKSACFAALNHKLQRYYHTRMDTYTNLSKETLDLAYKVCMKTLEIYDKDGLPEA
ncbi:MAG: M20/M25/M40 family metallo-hydrolase [Christensenellaceae bacterium]|nr:M20/M25/M40 family metallo-hydrolase [Christensenellaceae bacterium]